MRTMRTVTIRAVSAPVWTRCPDCSAECDEGVLVHDVTCWTARRRRVQRDADRIWFTRNRGPDTVARMRMIAPCERDEVIALGGQVDDAAQWVALVLCPVHDESASTFVYRDGELFAVLDVGDAE